MLSTSPQFKASQELAEKQSYPNSDMGIKLLAYELQQAKYLFLWWD
jgi:hypothetical protein